RPSACTLSLHAALPISPVRCDPDVPPFRTRIEESGPIPRSQDVRAPSEWELVLRCRAGSTAAYGLLVERYQDRALALAGALLQEDRRGKRLNSSHRKIA